MGEPIRDRLTIPVSCQGLLAGSVEGLYLVGAENMEEMNCWEYHRCTIRGYCPAHPENGSECWTIDGTLCSGKPKPPRSEDCLVCGFYKEVHSDDNSG
jgi:hypothetical protein